MKKIEHNRIVRHMAEKHKAEIARMDRLVEKLAADRDHLTNELNGCREALQETTAQLEA